jgi:hypothetical protein
MHPELLQCAYARHTAAPVACLYLDTHTVWRLLPSLLLPPLLLQVFVRGLLDTLK